MSVAPTLALVAALQLVAQFVLQLVVLSLLGVGARSDAFVAAQAVPMVLTSILATSLQYAWQSRLAVADVASGRWHAGHRVAHAQALMALIAVAIVLVVTAPLWSHALYAGLDAVTRALVLDLTPPLLAACVFTGAAAVLAVAERGRDRLVAAEVVSLLATVAAVAAAWFAVPTWGVQAAAWVVLARSLFVWLGLLVLVGGSRPDWSGAWHEREAWRVLRPLAASSGIYKSAPLIDRFWSALGPTGSVTLFGLAQSGVGAVVAVFERSLSMPAGPGIARSVARHDVAQVRRLYRRAVVAVALASAGAGAGLLAVQPWWADALHGLLGTVPEQAATLWWLCAMLLGYLFVGAAGTAVVSVFYALGDTRTPALIGLAGFAVGVVAKSLGFLAFGLTGLAAATSLYYLGNLVALVLAVEHRVDRLEASDRSTHGGTSIAAP